ncbi:alpha/beta hydrolase [Uliginosibacterium sp. H1]|uniref:alpha/beta hydrolase n=1 Tax=Uliginosibacterium sp. H1 TaxID=3114757 RepID=UPI002E176E67|nr:alpha/beta fold hydrolase [Uliginosibacterium sp. H1]
MLSGDLEVIHCLPKAPARPTPLLFVHGAYAGAWQWADDFLPYFAQQGWSSYALSLSGHGASRGRAHLDILSIENYVDDVREVAAGLGARPVLIGHSMGGMVVQKFLEVEDVPAVVLMSSVPPTGLISSTLGMFMNTPNVLLDLNRIMGGGLPHLATVREALFHLPVDGDRLQELFLRFQPESMRAVWDMTFFNLPNRARMYRPPMLVLGAQYDRIIPAEQVRHTGESYGVPVEILPDTGHAMMLESNWEIGAARIAAWLNERGL